VLTHDVAAFVEEIAAPRSDRHAVKLRRQAARAELDAVHAAVELRLAENGLERLGQGSDEESDSGASSVFGRWRRSSASERDTELRRLVAELRDKLRAQRERVAELELQLREYEATQPRNVSYRLHSEHHHATYSQTQFARMSESQRTRPVLVTTLRGQSWWWYLDRFWWDDERLAASEVRSLVHDRDTRTMRHRVATEHARAVAVGDLPPVRPELEERAPQSVRTAVWTRDGGRCVDCGGDENLVFDVIVPVSRGGSLNAANIELRCRSCLAMAGRSSAGADEAANEQRGAGRRRSRA
jgi:5-methylcytosine-specific restriction endonuclease McrA